MDEGSDEDTRATIVQSMPAQTGAAVAPEEPGFFSESLHKVLPENFVNVFRTAWRLLTDHRQFFREVFAGNWSLKLHPAPFFVTCLAMSTAVLEFAAPENKHGIPEWLYGPLVLLLYAPQFALVHRFLKPKSRTSKQTIYVLFYSAALGSLMTAPASLIDSKSLIDWAGLKVALSLITLGLVGWYFIKHIRILRFTHDVGFWRYMWASFLASMLIWVPIGLLFVGAVSAFGLEQKLEAFVQPTEDTIPGPPPVDPTPAPEPAPSPAPPEPAPSPVVQPDPPAVPELTPAQKRAAAALAFEGTWQWSMTVRSNCSGQVLDQANEGTMAITRTADNRLKLMDLQSGSNDGPVLAVRGRTARAESQQVWSIGGAILTADVVKLRMTGDDLLHMDIDGTVVVPGSLSSCTYVSRSTLVRQEP